MNQTLLAALKAAALAALEALEKGFVGEMGEGPLAAESHAQAHFPPPGHGGGWGGFGGHPIFPGRPFFPVGGFPVGGMWPVGQAPVVGQVAGMPAYMAALDANRNILQIVAWQPEAGRVLFGL